MEFFLHYFFYYNNLNANIATIVGNAAAKNKYNGLTFSFGKNDFSSDIPAGFGALAITVKPPPVTAPETTAYLNSSEIPSTSDAKYVKAALSVIAVKAVAKSNALYGF